MILGMVAGAVIFGVITLLGGLIAGKEAMGLGDVKFMASLGLYFGVNSISEISLLAFFIASIISIILLIVRGLILKSEDEYIPFGPFLVVSAIASIFIPSNTVFTLFMTMCTGISDAIINIIQ
jgi:prepilin signal peptidase PulO-like enzyme (type II secretory pathway)